MSLGLHPQKVRAELARARDNKGFLRADLVVERARDPENYLHPTIWGMTDEKAAYAHRLTIARAVIQRYTINYETKEPTVVSLSTDRTQQGGGYREMGEVLSTATLRATAVKDALKELASWQRRHQHLTELNHYSLAGLLSEPQPIDIIIDPPQAEAEGEAEGEAA